MKDCYIVHDSIFQDSRGYFFESFNQHKFAALTGINIPFVQDNQSLSTRGVLRGLHMQVGEFAQAKLVRVLQGAVLDVVVDLRKIRRPSGSIIRLNYLKSRIHSFIYQGALPMGLLLLSEFAVFFL